MFKSSIITGIRRQSQTAARLLLLGCLLFGSAFYATQPVLGATLHQDYDLVVVEGTPGGITMAVRAAREGLDVLLVNHNQHIGGILSSGLGVWDTEYEGKRSPIYDEVRQAIFDYYRTTYGEKSEQYRQALPGKSGHTNGKFEPKVAELIFDRLVAKEKQLTVLKGYIPKAVQREKNRLTSLTLQAVDGKMTVEVRAKVFADCTYEGDLAALVKVPFRVGREARSEFHEPHAGKIFMLPVKIGTDELQQRAIEHEQLKLRKFTGFQLISPQSTGEADGEVQAFNYRTILSSDATNRLPVVKPADYDPEALKKLEFGSIVSPLPNHKIGWNRPQLIGPHTAYVEGDTKTRQQVMDAHWDATMGLLYFLQNDPSVTPERQKYFRQYGLAKDEFTDNGHRPYELYVREARRIVGRYVFTELDASRSRDFVRAPIHTDSIGITEWYMDAHACTTARVPGSLDEGKMMLHYETFPAQVPYRSLLPQGVDNLLVPVCLSSTHVAWGSIRLEPTWMNICESAGYAAAQAVKHKQTPAQIDTDTLLRTLAENRVMLTFFNDVDISGKEAWISAAEYFGTKGFFPDYNARMDDPLDSNTARIWADAADMVAVRKGESANVAKKLSKGTSKTVLTVANFSATVKQTKSFRVEKVEEVIQGLKLKPETKITRGEALLILWKLLP